MADESGQPLNRAWVENTYYPTLDTAIGTSYTYLHTTINWAITVLTVVVIFTFTRSSFPDVISWILLSLTLPLTAHFAHRSAKGYLNTMRWATIQREILKSIIDKKDLDLSIKDMISHYHINWQSPIRYRTVIYKLFFELGFSYLFAAIIGGMIYIGVSICIPPLLWLFSFICIIVTIVEFIQLRFSPYMNQVSSNKKAEELR